MLSFLFIDAMGNEYPDPDRDWLKSLMFDMDEDVWIGSSGDAGLICTENGAPKAGMTLIGRDDLGFMINQSSKGERTYTMTANAGTGKSVSVEVGGEPMQVPDRYFVPTALAWKAVEHYLDTGGRSQDFGWDVI
jgi:hypothetical protein